MWCAVSSVASASPSRFELTAMLVFMAAAGFILYVLFGYPLLLAILSRGAGWPVRKQPLLARVSVLLPVRNGEPWIRQKLESILALHYPRELVDVIVVSDGSTDKTSTIVNSF